MFSKRTFSAVDATVVIASQQQGQTVSTQDIAETLGMSVSYLESILKVLKSKGIIRSYRGPGGGYQLDADPAQLSIWDIVQVFQAEGPEAGEGVEADAIRGVSACFDGLFDLAHSYLKEQKLADWAHVELPVKSNAPVLQGRFKLKPLPTMSLPRVPNSVFQLPIHELPMSRVA
jgi:Rrf2 family iron-sulfur cluster assembly transcriptional regulator